MAAPVANVRKTPDVALRGSSGLWLVGGSTGYNVRDEFPGDRTSNCRVMTYSKDGALIGYCNGSQVRVVNTKTFEVVLALNKPRTHFLKFSPCGTVLAIWEPYAVTKDQPAGTPNLNLYEISSGNCLRSFVQKRSQGWCPQWTVDEGISARNVSNEIHFFEKNNYGEIVHKLHLQKLEAFMFPPKSRYPVHVAVYVLGSKGSPSFVRIFCYPNFGSPQCALANKSFYKADKCDLIWNNSGTALLILTVTESSAESYYGEQGLYFADVKGTTCLVPRGKNGPVYTVEWSPDSKEFCVVYGFMPAKATLYNMKCEPVFDFGTGPRNACHYNPHGTILCLSGFGNLRGNMEMWDVSQKKLISNPYANDATSFEWCADGVHMLTATTAPRLRVCNGFKVWNYTGQVVYEESIPEGHELWEAIWQNVPEDAYPTPKISYTPIKATVAAAAVNSSNAYMPPAMRRQPKESVSKPKYRDAYEPASNMKKEEIAPENMSKAALKNKKKREAKARKQQEEQSEESSQPSSVPPPVTQPQVVPPGGEVEDKRVRQLKKKLQQISTLKEQQAQGKTLEKNQLEKLQLESSLLQELKDLQL